MVNQVQEVEFLTWPSATEEMLCFIGFPLPVFHLNFFKSKNIFDGMSFYFRFPDYNQQFCKPDNQAENPLGWGDGWKK